MKYIPLFAIFCIMIFISIAFYRDQVRLSKDIEKVQIELNKPDTVYLQKINDTTFQKRNITYIIR